MTETEILDQMIRIYQDKKWIQHHLYQWNETVPDSPMEVVGVCLQGAWEMAALDQARSVDYAKDFPVAERLEKAIRELFPSRCRDFRWGAVVSFNDDPNTTFEDVLLVLKHAIGKAEDGDA